MTPTDAALCLFSVPVAEPHGTRLTAEWDTWALQAAFSAWVKTASSSLPEWTLDYDNSHLKVVHIKGLIFRFRIHFVTEQELLGQEFSLPESDCAALDLDVVLTVADENKPEVNAVISRIRQYCDGFAENVFLMEPRWVTALLLECVRPVLGRVLHQSTISSLDYFEMPSGAGSSVSIRRVRNRVRTVFSKICDNGENAIESIRPQQYEQVVDGPMLSCSTYLPVASHALSAICRFFNDERLRAIAEAKVNQTQKQWFEHCRHRRRIDIIDRSEVEAYFLAPEYYQMPLYASELRQQLENLKDVYKRQSQEDKYP